LGIQGKNSFKFGDQKRRKVQISSQFDNRIRQVATFHGLKKITASMHDAPLEDVSKSLFI
jgi:hypothetical protein